MSILREQVDAFFGGRHLDGDSAEAFLAALISETDEDLLADLFQAWNSKGISAEEIYEIARLMRARCTRVQTRHTTFVDVVGTGGSRGKTFNVSTAAAFVVSGAGLSVAKHGNRAATSKFGSADVLSALGIEPAVDAATAARCLDDVGMCFMFAPNFHRLSPTLGKVRRGLGFPTIFNCVGPLCNPAGAPHQLIGVWDRELVSKMASALSRLQTGRSWVVHAEDGLDEVSLNTPTYVAEVENGEVRTFDLSPDDFGIERRDLDGTRVSTAEESARLIRSVLEGERSRSAAEGLVIVNAAAALYVSGFAATQREAAEIASETLRTGAAKNKLEELAEAVRQ